MLKSLIFGTGVVCKAFMRAYNITPNEVFGFVESHKENDTFLGKPLFSVDEIGGVDFDEIYVASARYNMVEELFENKIDKEKIVLCHIKLLMEYIDRNGSLDVRVKLPSILTNKLFIENVLDENHMFIGNNEMIVTRDYCRTGTLQLISKEIKEHHIEGAVAELGVYQGDFSKNINALFPDRTLYLFDTFEGFDKREEEKNISEDFSSEKDIKDSDFSDTSVNGVLEKLPFPENVVVRKGLFPETIPNEQMQYAFVSIDCDLYEPIYAGLEYFYSSMSEGGYIMIHDYNMEKFSKGVHSAVAKYEYKIGKRIHKIPIPDECGTLVICK